MGTVQRKPNPRHAAADARSCQSGRARMLKDGPGRPPGGGPFVEWLEGVKEAARASCVSFCLQRKAANVAYMDC
eukprot:366229-Chlamydomonas_euryale.AAC.2